MSDDQTRRRPRLEDLLNRFIHAHLTNGIQCWWIEGDIALQDGKQIDTK